MTQRLLIGIALATLAPLGVAAEERIKADVECLATDQALVYDCMIMLTGQESGKPTPDAKVVVAANMPSMPDMAHDTQPVTATPTDMPGMYNARIQLDMQGEWALSLDVSGPTTDVLTHTAQFGSTDEGGMEHDAHSGHTNTE